MKYKILIVSLSLMLSGIYLDSQAQPGGGGGGQGQGGPPPGNGAAPIDGGAILLAIGAAAYGRSRMKKAESY